MDFPQPRRQMRGQPPRDRGAFRIAQQDGGHRPSHQTPILPDDDFEEESSIIRFLRER